MLELILMCILLHLFADYTLQGWLASGKQKAWWNEQINKMLEAYKAAHHDVVVNEYNRTRIEDEHNRLKCKYGLDWAMAMFEHSLYWTLVTFAPIIFLNRVNDWVILGVVVINTIFHCVIDDLKANKLVINLVDDQMFHFAQIIFTCVVCKIYFM